MESPLEVLSRAATLVQKQQHPAEDDSHEECSALNTKHQSPAKWKRDRSRSFRLPEYVRKPTLKSQSNCDLKGVIPIDVPPSDCLTPLDMSTKHRGQPPSYDQAISNSSYRAVNQRPTLATKVREDLPPGISMCDPIIDEHFRRSLGKDYLSLFASKDPVPVEDLTKVSLKDNPLTEPASITKERDPEMCDSPPPPTQASPIVRPIDGPKMVATAALSVDDHFAKALGETWHKLNNKNKDDAPVTAEATKICSI